MARTDLRKTAGDLNSGAIHLLRGLRAVDREAGLTPARLSALSVLVFGGPQPLGRLARVEGVAGPTMTRIVDGLQSLGLATREEHPDSARITLVTATDAGRGLMHAARDRRLDAIAKALRALSEQERDAVVAAAPAFARVAQLLREG